MNVEANPTPTAHGLQQFARDYNDIVRPADPYDFVTLVRSPEMLASRRNREISRLAAILRENAPLRDPLTDAVTRFPETRMTTS